MSLLATGRYVTIFPAFALRFSASPEIKVLPIHLPRSSEPHGIVTLKDRPLNPVAQLFIAQSRDLARHLAKEDETSRFAERPSTPT